MRKPTAQLLAIVGSTTDDSKFYEITEGKKGGLYCSCPHNTFRHLPCKHMVIVANAIRHGKVSSEQYINFSEYAERKYGIKPITLEKIWIPGSRS